jgi:mono/diheme cytochrome c family protein
MALTWKRGLAAAAGLAAIAALVTVAQGQDATNAPASNAVAANTPVAADAAVQAALTTPGDAAAAAAPADPLIEKGHYVAILGDCAACHTKPGGAEYAGGVGLKTPFGMIYSPNITPDKETGIGGWTKADFERAMHRGKDHNKANLYPAFPYPYYTLVTTPDVDALYAYLMAQPAVKNTPPPNGLGFPFNLRILLTPWNWLHFRAGEFKADPKQSAEWNRGKYLFDGLGHCAACHTPKNMMGGDIRSKAVQGGLLEDWWAPDLTGNKVQGLGAWTKEDLVQFLKTGANNHTSVYGSMTDVIQHSTSQMKDEDLSALAAYMKSLPASAVIQAKAAPPAATMAAGKAVYEKSCASCHGSEGKGEAGLYPRLAAGAGVNAPNGTGVAHIVLKGNTPGPTTTIQSPDPMPGFAAKLNDEQVAAVATYIRNSWGNKAGAVLAKDVTKLRARVVTPEPKPAPAASTP